MRKRKDISYVKETSYGTTPRTKTVYLCTVCMQERSKKYCSCGHDAAAMRSDDFVTLDINWHEIQTLTVWAEYYANSLKSEADRERAKASLQAIRERIAAQAPWRENSAPLSME